MPARGSAVPARVSPVPGKGPHVPDRGPEAIQRGAWGHDRTAPLNLEGAVSAPEETLSVPEGMVCKLQQVFWCPLKGFTDLLSNPLSS